MFPGGYFPGGYFPPGYWPKTGAARVGGAAVGGYAQRLLRMAAMQEYSRSLLDASNMAAVHAAVAQRAAVGAWLRKIEQDHQQKCLEWAAYSVVLTEL